MTRLMTLVLLAASASAAQQAPTSADRASWVALRDAKFAVPEGRTAFEMLRAMTPLIASTDPFLRDNVAYEAAAKWIYTDKLLTDGEPRESGRGTATLGAASAIPQADGAFLDVVSRSACPPAHAKPAPFLTQAAFDAFVDAITRYLAASATPRCLPARDGSCHGSRRPTRCVFSHSARLSAPGRRGFCPRSTPSVRSAMCSGGEASARASYRVVAARATSTRRVRRMAPTIPPPTAVWARAPSTREVAQVHN